MKRILTVCLWMGLVAAAVENLPVARGQTESAQPDVPRIELAARGETHFFIATGLAADELAAFEKLSADERRAVLRVQVASELKDPPPLAGTIERDGDTLRFTPRYPLEAGLTYHVTVDRGQLNSAGAATPLSAVFPLAKSEREPTTVVEAIYPSAEQLPENQLKFYLHFSAPMSRGEAYRHIHLLDENGNEVEAAFLELGEELWDAGHRRFTLLCDPGRVKRGLKPREELGPVLNEGARYTLVIDSAWRDATRTPLNSGARKDFSVGPPDDTPLDPATWEIAAPAAGSGDPLLVRFGESLDHSLLQRVLWVTDPSGRKVSGTIATGDGEACWQFTPSQPWTAGEHHLVADTTLEDLAGNAIGRPFEVDEFKQVQQRIESKTVEIPFAVK